MGAESHLEEGDRVRSTRNGLAGVVREIPKGRGYVFVQWPDRPVGNLAGEWLHELVRETQEEGR